MFTLFVASLVSARVVDRLRAGSSGGLVYQEGCTLGAGFSYGNIGNANECLAQVTQPVPDCTTSSSGEESCYLKGITDTDVHWNEHMIDSTVGASSLVSAGVSVEGSGWGVSASASVSFTSSHQSASNSVSFYLGAAGSFYKNTIQNPLNLKLTDAAEYLLSNGEWDKFWGQYGTHYVSAIEYGGSFIGNIQIQSTSKASNLGIAAALQASFNGGIFSGGGSAKFATSMKNMAKSTKQTAAAMLNGGEPRTFDPQDPQAMGKVYNEWWSSLQQSQNSNVESGKGVAMIQYLRPLTDIDAIAMYVEQQNNQTVYEIFHQLPPTSELLERLSVEWAMSNMEMNTLKHIEQLECYQQSPALQARLAPIQKAIGSHLQVMESKMTPELLYQLGQDVANQNFAWFAASTPTLKYKKEIESAVTLTKACMQGARTCPMYNMDIDAISSNLVVTPGTDQYGCWDNSVSDLATCKSICRTQPGCVAVTFNTNLDQCWLKQSFYSLTVNKVMVSEAVDCKCYDWMTSYIPMEDFVDPSGWVSASTPDECQGMCAVNDDCYAWTWSYQAGSGPYCWQIKDGQAMGHFTSGGAMDCVSGPKNCPQV